MKKKDAHDLLLSIILADMGQDWLLSFFHLEDEMIEICRAGNHN
jgi:hypothetical protein